MRGTAWFQDLGVADAVLAGGKGANLGELGASRWHLPGAPGRNCAAPPHRDTAGRPGTAG